MVLLYGRLVWPERTWSSRVDLNHRPHAYQACALTAELLEGLAELLKAPAAHVGASTGFGLVGTVGIEPTTDRLRADCSAS